jgi:DNA-binding MarR family transcriptional regulator
LPPSDAHAPSTGDDIKPGTVIIEAAHTPATSATPVTLLAEAAELHGNVILGQHADRTHPRTEEFRMIDLPARRVPETAQAGPVSYAIFTLARAHRGYAAGMLRELVLHPGQELLLMQLLECDGQTQLLDSVGLDHSTVSKSLRRMQDAGLVVLERAQHDRRATLVRLTDKGRALREPIERMWAKLEETTSQGLDETQAQTFVALAQTIEQSITARTCPENST